MKPAIRLPVLVGAVSASLMCGAAAVASASEDPHFSRGDLGRLVLHAADAPDGTQITPISGPRLLEREGGLGRVLARLRRVGYRTDYGTQFEASSRRSAIGFFETLALLFDDRRSAARGLSLLHRLHFKFFSPARTIGAGGLGEAGWGVRGFFVHKYKSIIYGWRVGNLVQLATLAPLNGRLLRPDPAHATLRLARRLAAKAGGA